MIKLVIDYGYDKHSIILDKKTYSSVRSGEEVSIDGQGFIHEDDGEMLDHWCFNRAPGQIYFWLDNGAEFEARDFWLEE
jgi:hypothetical protein